jgi:hypothetical protein
MKSFIKSIWLCITLTYLYSASAQDRRFVQLNPTSYVFHANSNKIRKAVEQAFYKIDYWGGNKDFFGDSLFSSKEARILFQSEENIDDFYYSGGFFPESKVYHNKSHKELPYWVDLYINITPLDNYKTKVEVIAINPRVEIGKKLLPSLPHFVREPKFRSVLSTTVEEYRILQQIGILIGENNMPALKVPSKIEV